VEYRTVIARREEAMTDSNQEFARQAGICWHERTTKPQRTHAGILHIPIWTCGFDVTAYADEGDEHIRTSNPDFTDTRAVWMVMSNQDDILDFARFIGCEIDNQTNAIFIPEKYIKDNTGKLRDLAGEWIRRKG